VCPLVNGVGTGPRSFLGSPPLVNAVAAAANLHDHSIPQPTRFAMDYKSATATVSDGMTPSATHPDRAACLQKSPPAMMLAEK
jgi:hypothetical protein